MEKPTDVLHVHSGSEWTGFSSLCKILDLTHQFGEIFKEKLSNFLSDLPHRLPRDGRDPWGSSGPTTPDQGNLRVTKFVVQTLLEHHQAWCCDHLPGEPLQCLTAFHWRTFCQHLIWTILNHTNLTKPCWLHIKPFCRNHGDLVHV